MRIAGSRDEEIMTNYTTHTADQTKFEFYSQVGLDVQDTWLGWRRGGKNPFRVLFDQPSGRRSEEELK